MLRNRIRRTLAGVPRAHARQLIAFRDTCGDALPDEKREVLDAFLAARRGFFRRLAYLFRSHVHRQGLFENGSFRLLYLFGGYREDKK